MQAREVADPCAGLCLAETYARYSAVVVIGRPRILPCCFAGFNPSYVRTTQKILLEFQSSGGMVSKSCSVAKLK